ncbi:hypothetical protein BLOT_004790 [Blomia tropicalis]|nr:hypothetical protein BLOT_004790 [Blomia tropicalis]
MNSFLKELIGTRNADGTLERKDGDVDQSREERRRRRRQRRANLSMFQSLNTRTRTLRWIILVDLFLLSLTSLEIFTSDIRVVSFGKAKSVIVVMVTMILIGIGFNELNSFNPYAFIFHIILLLAADSLLVSRCIKVAIVF